MGSTRQAPSAVVPCHGLRGVHHEAAVAREVPLAHQLHVRAELLFPQVVVVGVEGVAEVPAAPVPPQRHNDVDGAAAQFFVGGASSDELHLGAGPVVERFLGVVVEEPRHVPNVDELHEVVAEHAELVVHGDIRVPPEVLHAPEASSGRPHSGFHVRRGGRVRGGKVSEVEEV